MALTERDFSSEGENPSIQEEYKALSVRFVANPELEDRNVLENDAMRQHTIGVLEWLRDRNPKVVLMRDLENHDPNAVMVRAMGKKVAYLCKEDACDAIGLMQAMNCQMLMTQLTRVIVHPHGFFYVVKPHVEVRYDAVPMGADWSVWQQDQPLILPEERFNSAQELSWEIRDLLRCRQDNATEAGDELCEYIGLWMQAVRYIPCREVVDEMRDFKSILSADTNREVRRMAEKIDQLQAIMGTPEVNREMADVWWPEVLADRRVQQSFATILYQCEGKSERLLALLDKVEKLMCPLPGRLYEDVGDLRRFFAHLNCLVPPLYALRGVLSLMVLRTLLCHELGVKLTPFFGRRVEVVNELRMMPTTIGRVMDFAQAQCKEYAEVLTVQRLTQYLRDEYLGRRDAEIDGILNTLKPAPNITIGTLNGSATGTVSQNVGNSTKLIE